MGHRRNAEIIFGRRLMVGLRPSSRPLTEEIRPRHDQSPGRTSSGLALRREDGVPHQRETVTPAESESMICRIPIPARSPCAILLIGLAPAAPLVVPLFE